LPFDFHNHVVGVLVGEHARPVGSVPSLEVEFIHALDVAGTSSSAMAEASFGDQSHHRSFTQSGTDGAVDFSAGTVRHRPVWSWLAESTMRFLEAPSSYPSDLSRAASTARTRPAPEPTHGWQLI
jgi:hypothetical protein